MQELNAVFAKVGINKLLKIQGQGIKEALTIIKLGSVSFSPHDQMTSVPGVEDEFNITDALEGDLLMRFGVRVSTEKEYPVRSVSGYLSDGTLLFVYAVPEPVAEDDVDFITYLTSHVDGLDMRFLLRLGPIPTNTLTVNCTDPGSMINTGKFAVIAKSQINANRRHIEQLIENRG